MKRVFLLPLFGIVFCLPAAVGAPAPQLQARWKTATGGELIGNGILYDDSTVFASDDKYIYGLDPESGKKLLKIKTADKIVSGPVQIAGGNMLVEHEDSFLGMYNPGGDLVVSFSIPGRLAGKPVVDRRGIVYCATENGYLLSFTHTGRRRWMIRTGDEIRANPVLTKDHNRVCVISGGRLVWVSDRGTRQKNGVPYSLENVLRVTLISNQRLGLLFPDRFLIISESGELLHSIYFTLSFRCSGGGITAADDLICYSRDGTVIMYHIAGYPDTPFFTVKLLFEGSITGYVLMDNLLVVGSNDWVVYAFPLPVSIGKKASHVRTGPVPSAAGGGRGVDYAVYKYYAESPDRREHTLLLDDVEKRLDEGSLGGMDLFVLDLLEELLKDPGGGGGREAYDGKADIRAKAAVLMGKLGNLATQEILTGCLAKEDHPDVKRAILYALAILRSDPYRQALKVVSRISENNNTLHRDEGLAADILFFTEKIKSYQGYPAHREVFSILYSIFRGDYPKNIRKAALNLLESG